MEGYLQNVARKKKKKKLFEMSEWGNCKIDKPFKLPCFT